MGLRHSDKDVSPPLSPPVVNTLTVTLEDEYKLFEGPNPTDHLPDLEGWLQDFPEAWAETVGLGLATAQPPVVVALKTSATPIQVK